MHKTQHLTTDVALQLRIVHSVTHRYMWMVFLIHLLISQPLYSQTPTAKPDGKTDAGTTTKTASQEKKTEQPKPTGEPLDFSTIVLKGTEVLNMPKSVFKQNPVNIRKLNTQELDTINSLEKQSSLLLPLSGYPSSLSTPNRYNGYLRGEFGMFVSPELEVGYGGTFAGYSLYGNGYFNSSSGHRDNAQFLKAGANLSARYVAPENYVVFGGSTTETNIGVAHNSYNFFANPNAPARSTTSIQAGVATQGVSADLPFTAYIKLQALSLSQDRIGNDSRSISENGLALGGTIGTTMDNLALTAKLALDFRNLRSNGMAFHELGVNATMKDSSHTLSGSVGMVYATTSESLNRYVLNGELRHDWCASQHFTLRNVVSTGLNNSSFAQQLIHNPYISDSALIDFTKTSIGVRSGLLFHPTSDIQLQLFAGYKSQPLTPVFVADSGFSFNLVYAQADFIEFGTEGSWSLTRNDNISGTIRYLAPRLDNSNRVPFIAPLTINLLYNRFWSDAVSTSLQFAYTGERTTSLISSQTLPSFVMVNVRAEYRLSRSLIATLRFDNLTNSSIFVWEGFQERGAFASAGMTWQF